MIGNDDVKEFAKTVLESLLRILNEKQKRLTLGIFSSALSRCGKLFGSVINSLIITKPISIYEKTNVSPQSPSVYPKSI